LSTKITPFKAEIAFWVLVCCGLGFGIGFETRWGTQLTAPIASKENSAAIFDKPLLARPFTLPAADHFLEISLRPIFIITRRPAPAAPLQEPPKPKMEKGKFALTGTMIIGGQKFAHLLRKSGNKALVAEEGKTLDGYAIKEIRDSQVTLEQYGDTETLTLQTAKGSPVPPVPPTTLTPPATSGPPVTSVPPPAAARKNPLAFPPPVIKK
jgi:type II secretory pathway component PulC